ncbi:MAG: hypothetical protein HC892_05075 [Saprospiraceae bacterium]|nr:hypothetical protein [Saprospiraceae bacterium]
MYILGGIAVITGLFFTIQAIQINQQRSALPDFCPSFSEAAVFHTLILPFKSFSDKTMPVHQAIRTRLNLMADSLKLSISNEIAQIKESDSRYPDRFEDAAELAQQCGAKLIIWGNLTEDAVLTRYKFTDEGDRFTLNQLSASEGATISVIPTLTNILTEGELLGAIEQSMISLLLGVAANRIGDDQEAVMLLNTSTIHNDSSNLNLFLLKAMHLADSQFKQGQLENSEITLSEVLKAHPDYFLARMNRSALHFKAQNYVPALEDLNIALNLNPSSIIARYTRAKTFEALEFYDLASEDLHLADSIAFKDTTTFMRQYRKSMISFTELKIKENILVLQKEIRVLKRETYKSQQENENVLNTLIQTNLKVGDIEGAKTVASKLKNLQPSTLDLIRLRYQACLINGKTEEALYWKNEVLIKAEATLR